MLDQDARFLLLAPIRNIQPQREQLGRGFRPSIARAVLYMIANVVLTLAAS